MTFTGDRFLNIGLHSATLGTRFLFIFFLARYLEPALVGYYGLFTATIGYSLYFVGLDFYTYVTREILKTDNRQRGRLLKSQAVLSGFLYLIFLPFATIFLWHADWPSYLMLWFFPILLLEHFNQEMSRLLIALSEQITASVILFVRQGSWALVIVAVMTWDVSSRHLQSVMALWAIAGLAAAAAGAWKLRKLQMGGWSSPPDWQWIRKGLIISISFLAATLALRGIQTVDRYWVKALGGIEIVGAYVLLLGVAGTLLAFLDAGVFAFTYPVLIKMHQAQETDLARAKVRQMLGYTSLLCAGFSLISWLLLPYLLRWINNPIYLNAIDLYPWLLLAMVINALSMVPHFALYARGHDRSIIYSHIAALIVFVLTAWVFSIYFSVMAVPISLNFSFAVILIWKTVAYWRIDKTEAVLAFQVKTN